MKKKFNIYMITKKRIPYIVVSVLLVIFLGVIVFQRMSGDKKEEAKVEETFEEPKQKEEPTPEPTVVVDKSEFEILAQNGTGKPGTGKKLQEDLEAKGYTVSDVGNAEEFEYTESEIQAKESVSDAFLEALKSDMEADYGNINIEKTLDDDDENDVIFIAGGELEPTAKPEVKKAVTAAPTSASTQTTPATSPTSGTTPTPSPTPKL